MHGSPSGGRRSRGSVLPAILALAVGVGAVATAFTTEDHREHQRERFEAARQTAYLDAWAQMEIASEIVNASPYDAGTGENIALSQASARSDRTFVDRDGHPTGVTCTPDGPAGFFLLTSEARVGDARCRVTALMRSRQSFADFDCFVASHSLGISGGTDASARHADAPDGDIHTNKRLLFYFPDRHFAKPVTAVEGFDYVAGAVGPADPQGDAQNNWFWGPTNAAANRIDGLTDVDLTTFGSRSDNLLNLDGPWDFAKVKLKGPRALVEHWQLGHDETQLVTTWQEQFHYETRQREVLRAVTTTTTRTVPVYAQQQVWVLGPVAKQQLVAQAWDETVNRTRQEARQRWIEGGGGGATGGGGTGTGGVGYWETYYVTVAYTEVVHHPAQYQTYYQDEWHWETRTVQTGTTTVTDTTTAYQPYVPARYEDYQVKVSDGWTAVQTPQTVFVAEHKVASHDVPAHGTIFVNGRVEFLPMTKAADGFDVQTLQGALTIASNDDVRIRESIVYAAPDAAGAWQTAFLNGADRTKEYQANPAYTGASVLGIIARNDVEVRSDVPDQCEIDGTILARDGEFRVRGVNVASATTGDAVVTTTSGGFVKMSLRRLGGVISNQRPVTTYVDSGNAVTRGFVFTKSVYDSRLRVNPPFGFPTLNRPRVVATIIREIN